MNCPQDKLRLFLISLICDQHVSPPFIKISTPPSSFPSVFTALSLTTFSTAFNLLHPGHFYHITTSISTTTRHNASLSLSHQFQKDAEQYNDDLIAANCEIDAIKYIKRWRYVYRFLI